MTLRDHHVVITGGSSGIGLAAALRAAFEGARVSLIARDPGKLESAKAALLAAVPAASVATASADVSIAAQLSGALQGVEAANGPTDILIASAGIARPGYFDEIAPEVFERTMAVNYLGTVYALKRVLPGMRRRGRGAVVLVSSGAGLLGLFGYTAYSPTKFALRGLAESLRAELHGSGVGVTIVYPPDTDTPQLAEENKTKPPETKALTAEGGLWTADAVARLTIEGLKRGQFAVTPGFQLTAVYRLQSLLGPLLSWRFNHIAARARKKAARG